jgi:hypothetical protein
MAEMPKDNLLASSAFLLKKDVLSMKERRDDTNRKIYFSAS